MAEYRPPGAKIVPSGTPRIREGGFGGGASAPIGYRIVDRTTGEQVGKDYSDGVRAARRMNTLNDRHGGHRYERRPIYENENKKAGGVASGVRSPARMDKPRRS